MLSFSRAYSRKQGHRCGITKTGQENPVKGYSQDFYPFFFQIYGIQNATPPKQHVFWKCLVKKKLFTSQKGHCVWVPRVSHSGGSMGGGPLCSPILLILPPCNGLLPPLGTLYIKVWSPLHLSEFPPSLGHPFFHHSMQSGINVLGN